MDYTKFTRQELIEMANKLGTRYLSEKTDDELRGMFFDKTIDRSGIIRETLILGLELQGKAYLSTQTNEAIIAMIEEQSKN